MSDVPAIRFEGFTDPWEQRKLGEFDIKTGPFGSTLHAEDYVEHGTPIVTTEHFKSGELPSNGEGIPQVSDADVARLGQYSLAERDIVFSRVGSVDLNAEVTNLQVGWLFSGRVLRVRPDASIDSTYLHYELGTDRVRQSIIERAVGLTMASINTRILGNTSFRAPASMREQRQIGSLFTSLDNLITLHQRKYDRLVVLKKALLDKMFPRNGESVPELRFEGFTDPWEQRKLGDVVSEFYCGQTPYRQNESFWGGSVNWLASGDLNRGLVTATEEKITELGQKSTGLRIVPKGTVVVATMGQEAPGTRGNCGILGLESTINQACMALFVDERAIDKQFLFQWYRAVGNEYGLHYTQGTKQQNYNADTLGNLDISLPEIEEQRSIGELFSSLDNLITLHQRKLETLRKLKSALLNKMFV